MNRLRLPPNMNRPRLPPNTKKRMITISSLN